MMNDTPTTHKKSGKAILVARLQVATISMPDPSGAMDGRFTRYITMFRGVTDGTISPSVMYFSTRPDATSPDGLRRFGPSRCSKVERTNLTADQVADLAADMVERFSDTKRHAAKVAK